MTIIERAIAGVFAVGLASSSASAADLAVTIEGARNARGVVSVCLFSAKAEFPDCKSAPPARQRTVPVADLGKAIVFTDLKPGVFAIAALHDENANGRLDTNFLGIPKEGIAVSNNRVPKFSAPRFDDASFALGGASAQSMRIVYR